MGDGGGGADMPVREEDLQPDVAKQLQRLRKRYRKEAEFEAVVDMYRNVNFEPEIAAFFMAAYDMRTYVHKGSSKFRPLTAGYEQRELEFLSKRGVKLA